MSDLMSNIVTAVASELHEQWRANRRLADGTYEPRWKDNNTIDIANTAFTDLPEKWQQENRAAAQNAVAAVHMNTHLEKAAQQIHEDWLTRNSEWAPAEQNRPYFDLDEAEKEKDRVVARIAASAAGVSLN